MTDTSQHLRIAMTSLVVLGTVVWIGSVFVLFRMPPVTLALIGGVGGVAGTHLGRRLRADLRAGEAALAAAIAVAVLVGATSIYREVTLARADVGIVAGAAAFAALCAWVTAHVGTGAPNRFDHVLACGAVSWAALFSLGALIAWFLQLETGAATLELTLMVSVPVAAGAIAVLIVPGANANTVFLGQWLAAATAVFAFLLRDNSLGAATVTTVLTTPLQAVTTIPGVIGAAIGGAFRVRFHDRDPQAPLPEARLR